MLTTTSALVLHTTRYGDTRLITLLYTKDCGILSVAYNSGGKRKRSANRGVLPPLTMVDITLDYHQRAMVQTLRSIDRRIPYTTIPYVADKCAQALLIADVLRHALRHEGTNDALFVFLHDSLQWLDKAHSGYANFHIIFLLLLTRYLGIAPNIASYQQGAAFSLNEGRYVPAHYDDNSTLTPEESALLPTFCRLSYRTMHLLRISRQGRNRCVTLLLTYYQRHLPAFPALPSFAILQELFA